MCCFSLPFVPVSLVRRIFGGAPRLRVSATNIYARLLAPGEQGLAYSMTLAVDREVAMILPLPVDPARNGEAAVRFLDLQAFPDLFVELSALFVMPQRKGGFRISLQRQATLAVHTVGSFVASYVPTRADFARVDPRFRLPEGALAAIPAYADYGFAVFQLAPGAATIHPMGLAFPTRAPDRLFFPTVHVHDGTTPRHARFDHALYYQRADDAAAPGDARSWDAARRDYGGLVALDRPVARRVLRGRRANADTWIT